MKQLHHLTGAVTISGQNIRQNDTCREIEVDKQEIVIKMEKKIQIFDSAQEENKEIESMIFKIEAMCKQAFAELNEEIELMKKM